MIADPLVIAAATPTPALNLAVVDSSKPYAAVRQDNGGVYSATIEHTPSKNGSVRHYIKVVQKKLVTSPTSGLDSYQTATVSCAIQVPPFGYSVADMTAMYELLDDVMRAASLAKILNNES